MKKKTLIVLLAMLILSSTICAQTTTAESWLTGWGYRKSHVINNATGAGTDYQVKVTVYYGSGSDSAGNVYLDGKCRTDFGDVRFTDDDGSTLLDYWLEEARSETIENFVAGQGFITAVLIDDSVIWAGFGVDLKKSADNGQTWVTKLTKPTADWGWRCIFKAKNGYLYASPQGDTVTEDEAGIYRSMDGGENWTCVLALPSFTMIWYMAEDSDGRLFAGDYGASPSAQIWRSTDNGASFSVVYDQGGIGNHVHALGIDPANDYIYAGVEVDKLVLVRSIDHGDTWTNIKTGAPCAGAAGIEFGDGFRLFGGDGIGNDGIWKTTDDLNFIQKYASESAIYWIKKMGDVYYASLFNDADGLIPRIIKSTDNGESWTEVKNYGIRPAWAGCSFVSNVGTLEGKTQIILAGNLFFPLGERLIQDVVGNFWVEVADDLSTVAQTIYVYYGKADATTTSNVNNTFVRVIDGAQPVVLGLPMNEGSGTTTYDQSGLKNNGALLPSGSEPTWVDGKYGKALSFDGANDYVLVADANSLDLSNMTVTAWVNQKTFASWARIISKQSGTNINYLLLVDASNRLAFYFSVEGAEKRSPFSTAISQDTWYHVAGVYDKAKIYLYINGVSQGTPTSQTGTPDTNNNVSTVGCRSDSKANVWNGIIDEVRIYNRALTAEEISDLYNNYGYMTPNYAGRELVRKYVSPEPAHGSWGNEEVSERVMIDQTFVSDGRADIGSVQTIGFHAKWTNDGSDVVGGSIYVNGTEYITNSTGWINVRAAARREAPDNFTIIALPDTQFYSASHPEIFESQTQWVVINAQSMNIVFVTHEGDIVNDYSSLSQWNNANNSMSKLDAGNMSYGVLPGNHDGSPLYLSNFNKFFDYSRFNGKSWYGGAYQNENTNNFELFHSGQDNYLIFHFQYDPSDQVLTWANSTLQNYPNRRVIVTTHSYLNVDGSRTDIGNRIWQNFVAPHADQIFLVLCGHNHGETQRTDIVNGHTVYQIMADYQDRTNGGNGWLRTLEFNPVEDKIYVRTYSPYLNNYETDADSQFTLDYDMTWAASSIVEKVTWIVTGVNCSGVTAYSQIVQNPSIIWDRIKIGDGGISKGSVMLGEKVTVWFKALYEYDNDTFDGANGVLYLNGFPMLWSTTNNQWQYDYTATTFGTKTFIISGVSDSSYNLTAINDNIGAQTLDVWSLPFSVISNSTISELTFNSTSKTLTFTVNGTTGTTGYTNVTIAKTLIKDISELKIYLDGNQINYTTTSTEYTWVIHITYHHSTHKVVMILSSLHANSSSTVSPEATTIFIGIIIVIIAAILLVYKKVHKKRARRT
jgi:hypothetical protein